MDEHLDGIIAVLYYHWSLAWIEDQLLVSRTKIYDVVNDYDLPRKRGHYQSDLKERNERIRQLHDRGVSVSGLASDFELTRTRIYQILSQGGD